MGSIICFANWGSGFVAVFHLSFFSFNKRELMVRCPISPFGKVQFLPKFYNRSVPPGKICCTFIELNTDSLPRCSHCNFNMMVIKAFPAYGDVHLC